MEFLQSENMKNYKEISAKLKKSVKIDETYRKYDRESYLRGDLFKAGDIVDHGGRKAEIISIGTNYVTLIREGKSFKSWITDISHINVESSHSKPRNVNGQLVFKGYTTSNFNNDIVESFLSKYSDVTDQFAFFNCLVSCDNLIGVKSKSLIEFYHKYKNDYTRVSRYLNKFDLHIDRVELIGEALEIIATHNKNTGRI